MVKRVAIIGGGIAGLVCAYRLWELKNKHKVDLEIKLFEFSSRVGGTIQTVQKDGFIFERGPDSFLSEKKATLDLCQRLGLTQEIIGTRDQNRRVFVVKKNQLVPLPEGFYLVAPTSIQKLATTPLLSLGAKFRMMLEPFISKIPKDFDESIASFIRRRFGNEALTRLGQPMIAGIYSGDPEKLSILETLPRFKELEDKYGSVTRGLLASIKKNKDAYQKASGVRYSLFLSFEKGMQTLTDFIACQLPPETIQLNAPIKKILRQSQVPGWALEISNGTSYQADALVAAIPPQNLKNIINETDPDISTLLSQINFESVATINFFYRAQDIEHPMDGFGFVIPAIENKSMIACTFGHQKFEGRAPNGFAIVRAFVGGTFGKKYLEKNNDELVECVRKDLVELLGISKPPLFWDLCRYPNSLPQYELGHRELVKKIEEKTKNLKGFYFTGSAYRGVGISDLVQDAQNQADQLFSEAFL